MAEMGLPQLDATTLRVDNSGAIELSHDRKSCNKSRHVDRRYFKVRELQAGEQALGEVHVEHVDTALNAADVLTKPISRELFDRHCATLMGESRAGT